MPPALMPAFTLRDDTTHTSYRFAPSHDRLQTAVTFDDEDTGDYASVIAPFSFAPPVSANRVTVGHPPTPPLASYDDDEVTHVDFVPVASDTR